MVPSLRTVAVLLLVGLAALTNPLWLFPNDGETQYTYERSEITVENGTLHYEGADVQPDSATIGAELNGVDCQYDDVPGRTCGFDYHLRDEGAVTVEATLSNHDTPLFVELDGDYYRRNVTDNESGTTYRVEPVNPQTVLSELAVNVTGLDDPGDGRPALRAVYTGESVTAFERPERDGGATGGVFLDDGTYYTAVASSDGRASEPLFGNGVRDALSLLGVCALMGGVLAGLARVRPGGEG